jgi:hypothetical protein
MWNREKTKNFHFRQDIPITSDIDIFFKIFCEGGQLMLLDMKLAEYRRHDKSLSGSPENKLSRLIEETNTYFNCSKLLAWHKNPIIKILAYLHLSTRLYGLLEMTSTFFYGKISLAKKFLIVSLAFSNIENPPASIGRR